MLGWAPLLRADTATDFIDGLLVLAGTTSQPARWAARFTCTRPTTTGPTASSTMSTVSSVCATAGSPEPRYRTGHGRPDALGERGNPTRRALSAKNVGWAASVYICENFGALLRLPDIAPARAPPQAATSLPLFRNCGIRSRNHRWPARNVSPYRSKHQSSVGACHVHLQPCLDPDALSGLR